MTGRPETQPKVQCYSIPNIYFTQTENHIIIFLFKGFKEHNSYTAGERRQTDEPCRWKATLMRHLHPSINLSGPCWSIQMSEAFQAILYPVHSQKLQCLVFQNFATSHRFDCALQTFIIPHTKKDSTTDIFLCVKIHTMLADFHSAYKKNHHWTIDFSLCLYGNQILMQPANSTRKSQVGGMKCKSWKRFTAKS